LIDDIFGELDPVRRNQLLANLPGDAQKLVTATTMDWSDEKFDGRVFELRDRTLIRTNS
jgi:DNA replication and repair protein RecF